MDYNTGLVYRGYPHQDFAACSKVWPFGKPPVVLERTATFYDAEDNVVGQFGSLSPNGNFEFIFPPGVQVTRVRISSAARELR